MTYFKKKLKPLSAINWRTAKQTPIVTKFNVSIFHLRLICLGLFKFQRGKV